MARKIKVAVVIPYYKNDLTVSERDSLQACIQILGSYDIFLMTSESMDLKEVIEKYPLLKAKRFEGRFFQDLRGYNKLMLSEHFYAQFRNYTYILIYQLDAFVFKDELQMWASKGYDYIGAPWIHAGEYATPQGIRTCRLKYLWYKLKDNRRGMEKYFSGQIGNGGFSLRKVTKMLQITHLYKKQIAEQLDDSQPFYAEDLWLLFEPKYKHRLRKPYFKKAIRFSMEMMPEKAYQWNNYVLPFGCHAFNREPYKQFWSSFIPSVLED